MPGYDGGSATLNLPTSTANNVLFTQRVGRDPDVCRSTPPVRRRPPTGRVVCTALVEEGGTQLLTVRFDKPGFAAEIPYQFTVPGVDGAVLPVVVP